MELSNTKTIEIGQYKILEIIGRGGMGVVYKALDTTINRIVAIKMINIIKSEKLAKRFIKEAMICAQCKHPNIVSIYNISSYHNIPYIVMEYINGEKLLVYLQKHNLKKWDQYVDLMIKITQAIEYIHRKGIIHRDLKPDNIIIRPNGEPMIFDFGISKIMGNQFCELTATGEILGTVQYMAPEQILTPKDITQSIDIYSLGAIFYHMITNRPPVQEATNISMMYHIASLSPILPHTLNKTIPKSLENIILKALDKNINSRYSNASELILALTQYKKDTKFSHINLRYKVNDKLKNVKRTKTKSKKNKEDYNIEEEYEKVQTLTISRAEYHKYVVHKHYVNFLKFLLFIIIIIMIYFMSTKMIPGIIKTIKKLNEPQPKELSNYFYNLKLM